jgi:hypothetical protein
LGALAKVADERGGSKSWPDSPRALSDRLRRAATFLRKIGIEIGFEREGRVRTRLIRITVGSTNLAPEWGGTRPSTPSASSAPKPKPMSVNGFATPDLRTVANDADGCPTGPAETVRANPLNFCAQTAADDADAKIHDHSAPQKPKWSARI